MTQRAHSPERCPRLLGAAVAAGLLCSPAYAAVPARMAHTYDIATITGKTATTAATLSFDPRSNELLVLAEGIVRVFNDAGMEIYTFGEDEELRGILSIAPFGDAGDYLVLIGSHDHPALIRCNYRGAPIARVEPSGLPAAVSELSPFVVGAVGEEIYLGDPGRKLVVVIDSAGTYVRHLDLAAVVGTPEQNEELGAKGYLEASIRGLQFDARGNTLFTVPTLFRAFVVAPDGTYRSFGKAGGTPGTFNIAIAITKDQDGNVFVADMLRCSVSVWSPELHFVTQFGGRGRGAGKLVGPVSIVAGNGRVFVSQGVRRGVSVFTPVTG